MSIILKKKFPKLKSHPKTKYFGHSWAIVNKVSSVLHSNHSYWCYCIKIHLTISFFVDGFFVYFECRPVHLDKPAFQPGFVRHGHFYALCQAVVIINNDVQNFLRRESNFTFFQALFLPRFSINFFGRCLRVFMELH